MRRGGLGISSFKSIADSIENKIGLDLFFVLIIAVLLVIFVLILPDGNILRIIFGLPFLLILPGYSLVSVLWLKRIDIDMLERAALSLGLSIALVVLVGLGLSYTPFGITLESVLFTLFGLIIILVGLTRFRRLQVNPAERFKIDTDLIIQKMEPITSTDKLMVLVIIITIVIGGILLIFIAMNPPMEGFTELFILDENQSTDDYPTDLNVNQSGSIFIFVINHEQKTMDYNIVVWLRPENGTDEIIEEFDFLLENDKEWMQELIFSISYSGLYKLEIELYKESDTVPYTTNHLWIDVKE